MTDTVLSRTNLDASEGLNFCAFDTRAKLPLWATARGGPIMLVGTSTVPITLGGKWFRSMTATLSDVWDVGTVPSSGCLPSLAERASCASVLTQVVASAKAESARTRCSFIGPPQGLLVDGSPCLEDVLQR